MATLQDLRKRRFRTIKLFAEAYGCGATKASEILRGHYHLGLSKDNVKHLASVLGVGFVECADACDETFAELKRYRGDAWKRTARTHKGIWSRWLWEERYVQEGIDIGDWRAYRQRYIHRQEQQSRQQPRERQSYTPDCYTILGISSGATAAQIKEAFRAKVKAAADGKGGYNGDMHKLVQAKEQALVRCR